MLQPFSPLCHSDRTAIRQEQTTCFSVTCDSQWRQPQVGRQSNRSASYLSLPRTVPACGWLTVATMLKERHLLLTSTVCVCEYVANSGLIPTVYNFLFLVHSFSSKKYILNPCLLSIKDNHLVYCQAIQDGCSLAFWMSAQWGPASLTWPNSLNYRA